NVLGQRKLGDLPFAVAQEPVKDLFHGQGQRRKVHALDADGPGGEIADVLVSAHGHGQREVHQATSPETRCTVIPSGGSFGWRADPIRFTPPPARAPRGGRATEPRCPGCWSCKNLFLQGSFVT